jgi:predicted ester cyclase
MLGMFNLYPKTQQQTSQTDKNKAAVWFFFDQVFNKGNLAVVDELASSYTFDGQPQDPSAFKTFVTNLRTNFPNLQFVFQTTLAEGNQVAVRWQLTATHTGGTNPTGNQVTATGTNILTFNSAGAADSNIQNGTCTIVSGAGTKVFTDAAIYQFFAEITAAPAASQASAGG